ncbi:MAG: hypothetical protein ACOCTU_00175 [Bacteroidota bacterium]
MEILHECRQSHVATEKVYQKFSEPLLQQDKPITNHGNTFLLQEKLSQRKAKDFSSKRTPSSIKVMHVCCSRINSWTRGCLSTAAA